MIYGDDRLRNPIIIRSYIVVFLYYEAIKGLVHICTFSSVGRATDSQSRGYVSATRGRILEGAQLTVICFVLSRIFAIRKINPDMDD